MPPPAYRPIKTLAILALLLIPLATRGALPACDNKRITVDLVASEPDIVTPTGIASDLQGRAWVIESNTHFPPKNYKRHATDRILILEDFGTSGKAGRVSQFADGFIQAMNIAVRPGGLIYVVCRNEIVLLHENDPAKKVTLVRLETKATYPHNGLNGIAFSPDGVSFDFCLGLNAGFSYKLFGSDGSSVSGGGEGGTLYRCKVDGSHIERVATGFWNVHDLTFDAAGRLFAVDNDPDDRPPCRLLDIIDGGDYGWQFRNGRKGVHPFTSWNGELAGTLPMISPTGEAPSGIVSYHLSGLPEEYQGHLIVTSWGDHIIQHFALKPKGASYTSEPQTLVRGGEDFRPVGIAIAPDGSMFVSDWVDKSYTLHGKGRVWRIRMKEPPAAPGKSSSVSEVPLGTNIAPYLSRLMMIRPSLIDQSYIVEGANYLGKDPFLVSAAITNTARSKQVEQIISRGFDAHDGRAIIEALAVRRSGSADAKKLLPSLLQRPNSELRRIALQWIGEERLNEFADRVPHVLDAGPLTKEVLKALWACQEKLATEPPREGKPATERPGKSFAADFLFDEKQDLKARRVALDLIDPLDPALLSRKLAALIEPMGLDVVKALACRADDESQQALAAIATEEARGIDWRREAILGLARSASSSAHVRGVLLSVLNGGPRELRPEALRALRGTLDGKDADALMTDFRAAINKPGLGSDDERREWAEQMLLAFRPTPHAITDADGNELQLVAGDRPSTKQAWQQAIAGGGDADAGRYLFSLATGPRCFACHQIDGRGGAIGPDLSKIGGAMTREKIVESILDPSREIAPFYVPMVLELKDGQTVTGVGLPESGTKIVYIAGADGKKIGVNPDDIIGRREEKISIMPANLVESMTVKEFRDLVAYLGSLK